MEVTITHTFTKTFAHSQHFNQLGSNTTIHWRLRMANTKYTYGSSVEGPGSFHWFTPSASFVQQADPTCTASVITRGTGRKNPALVTSVHAFTIALHSFLSLAHTLASSTVIPLSFRAFFYSIRPSTPRSSSRSIPTHCTIHHFLCQSHFFHSLHVPEPSQNTFICST